MRHVLIRHVLIRHVLIRIAAAVLVVGFAIGVGPASAAPLPTLNGLASQASPVEKATITGIGPAAMAGITPTATGALITGPIITATAIGRITGITAIGIIAAGSRHRQDLP